MEKACHHGYKPAATCGRCAKEAAKALAKQAEAALALHARHVTEARTLLAAPPELAAHVAAHPGLAVGFLPAQGVAPPVPPLAAPSGGSAAPSATPQAAAPSSSAPGVHAGGGSPPLTGGPVAGVTRDVTPPFPEQPPAPSQAGGAALALLDSAQRRFAEATGLHPDEEERAMEALVAHPVMPKESFSYLEAETEERPPASAMRAPGEAAELPKWGRDLPGATRLSRNYRLAMYREGEDMFLVEMVKEGKVWRERMVLGPGGFDEVEGKLLELVVENTSP